jgi:hypothetical protein
VQERNARNMQGDEREMMEGVMEGGMGLKVDRFTSEEVDGTLDSFAPAG